MAKTIILAEDHDDSRSFLKFMLELDGFDVLEASNGQQAVDFAENNKIDLIIMDIAMPIKSGLTAIAEIRNIDGAKSIPAIALSAFGNSFHEKAFNAGFNYFIDKPVNFIQLKAILTQYLGKETEAVLTPANMRENLS
jgi:two-component system cell cycle response regulator DivK